MEQALITLNELERDGFFERYAMGGAMAAIFYMEPFETEDLDVFILLPPSSGPLASLAPIYEELRRRGCREDGPYIRIGNLPVQFLVAHTPLVAEAVAEARTVSYKSTTTRVPTAEHLAAIMVETGRRKDRLRLDALREQVSLDEERLLDILSRHHLTERFRAWTTT